MGGCHWSRGLLTHCSLPGCPASAGEESWTDSEVDSSCSGQPIHLWQFLRELLLKPHSYGRFIRWLNKEKGEQGARQGLRGQRGRTGVSGVLPGFLPGAGRREGGGWAEGWSCPHLCPECQIRPSLDPPGVCVRFVATSVPRPGSALFRVPSPAQCL